MKSRYVIVIIIVAAVLVAFPTPHSHTELELVRTLDCSRTLKDGYSLKIGWTDMDGWTKIEVDIQSTEEVRVKLKGVTDTFYDSAKKVHNVSFGRSDAAYDVTVTNPSLLGTGPSAVMSGSINAYKSVTYQAWLPCARYRRYRRSDI